MKILLIAAALAAAPAGPAVAPDFFCDDVRALAAGAEEADPFRSLRDRNFRPRLLGGCFFNSAGGYTCGKNLAQRGETRGAFADLIHACLPGSTRSSRRESFSRQEVVRLGRFEAQVSEHGLDRGHVGRTINIYVASLPPERPR
jgi:hypothetical protein